MSIALIPAILSTAILLFLILRRGRAGITLITGLVAVASWLAVGLSWLINQWSTRVDITLPDLRYVAVAAILTGSLVALGKLLGKKAMRTVIVLVAVGWLAVLTGWLAGEWIGLLAVTMPSLIILFVGLVALPPFVLPVPPLPWKLPTLLAMLYTFLWLIGAWTDAVDMNVISFWVYLQGLMLILRPTFPLAEVSGFVPFVVFMIYGFIAVLVWRVLGAFTLTPFNLLVLTQGLVALSSFALPIVGTTRNWALGLSVVFGVGFLMALSVRSIDATVTNFLIMFLGVAAIERFLVSGQDVLDQQIGPFAIRWITAHVIFAVYLLVWVSGLASGELQPDWFSLFTFAVGSAAAFMPVFVRPIENWEGFKAIISYNLGTNYSYYEVVGGKLVERAAGKSSNHIMAGPGIVLSDAAHAAVIYGGGAFRRVAPPGVAFTKANEAVKEVVDLRPQLRSNSRVDATTKDGIPVTVDVFMPLRLACEEPQPKLGESFPFDVDSVRKAVHVQRISQDDGKSVRWDDLVSQIGERAVRDIIAEYKLDELRGFEVHSQITVRLKDEIRKRLETNDWGVELVGLGISNIEPRNDVIQGRIEYWQAHWESLITVLRAKADANETALIENARARVHRDLFLNLTEGLAPIKDLNSKHAYQLVVLNLLEAIEREGVTDPELTGQTVPQVQMLQTRLEPGRGSGASGGTQ